MQIKLPYIPFMNYSRQGLWLSTVLTIAAVLLIIVRGFNFGLEFTGGATIEMQYAQAADISHVRSVVEKIVPDAGVVQYGSSRDVQIRFAEQEGANIDQTMSEMVSALQADAPDAKLTGQSKVGGQYKEELVSKGLLAIGLACIGMIIYLGLRFEWKFALGAVLAQLHDVIITAGVFSLMGWTFDLNVLAALLAILAFSLSLIGTFLVRSGVLTSVHAFAADPTRGIYILALLVAITLPALILLIQRSPALASRAPYALLSRETGILANNWLMTGACLIVFTGTLYPLAADSLNLGKISVGAPYYNRLIVPLALVSLILLGIGPLLRWKNDRARRLVPRLAAVLALALAATLLTLTLADTWQIRTALAVFAAMTAAAAIIVDTTDRLRHRLPITRAYSGMTLAHLGYLITALGITATGLYSNEQDHSLKRGSVLDFAGYRLTLVDLETREGPNYTATVSKILVQKSDGTPVTVLLPSKRTYHSSTMPMTESARHITPTHDLYLALGEAINADTWAVRLQYKPYIIWIWLGALLMAAGAALAALPHRKAA